MYKTILFLIASGGLVWAANFKSEDLFKMRSAGDVQFSPDGSRIAYTVTRNDGPRGPIDSFGS